MKKLTKKIATLACSATAICALAFGGISAINASADNTDFEMINGASVRVDKTGIRFSCTVNESYLSGLTAVGGEYAGYTAELGTVIVPTVVLGGSELTATQTYTYNETAYETLKIALTKKDADKSTASVGYYNAVVIDIPAISYETDLSARSYIKLTKGETTEYIYTDVTAVRSIGYVAVEAYNDAKTSAEQKEGLKKLLDANLGTIGFDKAAYEVAVGEEIAYQVTANEYGYVLDSAALTKNNAIITSNNTSVATVEDGKIVGVAAGEAEITVKIGEKTAKATVTVTAPAGEVTDATGKFVWKSNQNISVVNESFTWTNTTMYAGVSGGTYTRPKANSYQLVTNGEYVQVNGKFALTANTRLALFMGMTINEAGASYTEMAGDKTLSIRLTDISNPKNVLTFLYYVEGATGYFGFTYTNGTVNYSRTGKDNMIPMPSNNFGNSNGTATTFPRLCYVNDYKFGFVDGTATNFSDVATGNNLATQLSADSFAVNGFYMSFSSGTTAGMVIGSMAEYQPIEDIVTDSTGTFSWKRTQNVSVVNESFTWTNTTMLNGVSGGTYTRPKANSYQLVTNGEYVQVNGKFALTANTRLALFMGMTINEAGASYTEMAGDKTLSIRLTDISNPKNVLTFLYYVEGATGYFGFTYTNGTVNYSRTGKDNMIPMPSNNFGNSNGTATTFPRLCYVNDYKFGFVDGTATNFSDVATGNNLAAQLSADSFGANGFYMSFSSGTTAGMVIGSMATFTKA